MAELELLTLAVLVGAALVGSTISGFLGMGGGIFLLTVLFLCGLEPAIAIPIHALVQLTSNGTRAVLFREHVRWSAWRTFALCALPFPVLGLAVAGKAPYRVLEGRPRNGAFAFRKSCPRLAFMRGSISGQHE